MPRSARPSVKIQTFASACMIQRFLAVLAFGLWSSPSPAEPVRVRSGEHPGFSRLVLEFPDRPAWSVREKDGRVEVVVTPAGWSFDLSQVFERIPKSRISDVTATESGLALVLGCTCRVTAFEVRGAALVIDVADASSDADVTAVELTTAVDALSTGGAASSETVSPLIEPVEPKPSAPLPAWTDSISAAPRAASPAALPPAAPDALPSPDAAPGRNTSTLDRLAEGVARAASRGALRLAPRPDSSAAPDTPVVSIGGASEANLRLRIPGEEEWTGEPAQDARCLGDHGFDLAAWSPPGSDPAALIASARGRLTETMDNVDEARAVDLARLYIALGFGAEARAVIALLAPRSEQADVLGALAHIVDDDPILIAGLDDQVDCPGRAQLWIALAIGHPGTPEDTLVAIAELPLALRRHLAARLIAIFLEAGDPATAEAIRATVQRAPGPHGDGFELASARIDSELRSPAGIAKIRDLSQGASPVADAALELYLALGNEADSPAEPPVLAQAETRADDLRGTESGARLEAELILAAIRTGDFDLAGSRLANALAAKRLPDAREDDLVAQYVTALASNATDEVLLVNAAAFEDAFAAHSVRGSSASELARRLVDLGFWRLARAYAATDQSLDLALEAELRLQAGDPDAALALIDGLAEPDERHLAVRTAARLSLDRLAETTRLGSGPAAPAATPPRQPGEGAALPDLIAASETERARLEDLLRDLPRP